MKSNVQHCNTVLDQSAASCGHGPTPEGSPAMQLNEPFSLAQTQPADEPPQPRSAGSADILEDSILPQELDTQGPSSPVEHAPTLSYGTIDTNPSILEQLLQEAAAQSTALPAPECIPPANPSLYSHPSTQPPEGAEMGQRPAAARQSFCIHDGCPHPADPSSGPASKESQQLSQSSQEALGRPIASGEVAASGSCRESILQALQAALQGAEEMLEAALAAGRPADMEAAAQSTGKLLESVESASRRLPEVRTCYTSLDAHSNISHSIKPSTHFRSWGD